MRIIPLLFATLVGFSSVPVLAGGTAMKGSLSCAQILTLQNLELQLLKNGAAKEAQKAFQPFTFWALGYLSGRNMVRIERHENPLSDLSNLDAAKIESFTITYCQNNQSRDSHQAIETLEKQLPQIEAQY